MLQQLQPIKLLEQLSNARVTGRLQVSNASVAWSIYLKNGNIVYASHSLGAFDSLDRNLRFFSKQIPTLTTETRSQVRLLFEQKSDTQSLQSRDYQAICWLVEQKYLSPAHASALIEKIVKEFFELFFLVQEANCHFIKNIDLPGICQLPIPKVIEYSRQQLRNWQALGPQIWSPYQRPYLASQTQSGSKIAPEVQQKFGALLKGFSFRHLGALLSRDSFILARSFHPYIVEGIIILRDPQSPFDRLPRFPVEVTRPIQAPIATSVSEDTDTNDDPVSGILTNPAIKNKKHTIVCVDDSLTILNEIKRFLGDENFAVFTIDNASRALMQISRIKPDLILLDIGIPGMDGYQICRLLRNHSGFKSTPIIMVSGNTGIVDKSKAKLVGASDYLTKPFNQEQLLQMVFRHLA
ncbi:MAG: response regulator [Aphanothece sp. CMT-3BRIN-NPC111]|jgi:twitching motility two-component system response regulator PilG|nr:response regulator [Aphanothece sp. CMT-3BRIN-NPC111]